MGQRNSGYARIVGDHYATPGWVVDELLSVETFESPIWECAPGQNIRENQIINTLVKHGHTVIHNYADFLKTTDTHPETLACNAIITNPPFNQAELFCRHALYLMRKHKTAKIAMLLPLAFDAAKSRIDLFSKLPFKIKHVLTKRIRWENLEQKPAGPSQNHAWYIWDQGYTGRPLLGWLPKETASE